MAINKLTVTAMNKELEALLKAFADKHGLTKGSQRIVYARDGSTLKLSVEFGDKATTGDMNPVYYKDLVRNGFYYGLSTDMIGKSIKTVHGMMKFVGMRGKYAIVEGADKKFWKYDPTIVATLLKAA